MTNWPIPDDLKTQNQVKMVILIDCVNQCNAAGYATEEEYDRHLRAMLKGRWNKHGQTEMPI